MTKESIEELIQKESEKKEKMKKNKKKVRLLTALIFVSVLVILGFLFSYHSQKYEFISPRVDTAVLSVYATGTVEPKYGASISPLISGRVEQILVADGDRIKKGQVLAVLDSSVEEAKLKELRANYKFLTSELARKKDLRNRGFYSDSEYERALNEYNVAKAQVEYQEELINRMKIKSPIDGIVIREDLDIGKYIKPDSEIFWVGQEYPLIVTVDVDEEDIPLVKLGQLTLIKSDAFIDRAIEGKVYKITPMGDAIDKNFRVRVGLPRDSGLMIGMTTEVNIVVREEPNSLILPVSVLIGNTVYVKNGKVGRVKPVKVKIGIKDDGNVQILEGITKDSRVVKNPRRIVKNGKK